MASTVSNMATAYCCSSV